MFSVELLPLVVTTLTVLASVKLAQIFLNRPKRIDLKGPPSNGFLIGRSLDIFKLTPNHAMILEEWARDFGPVYRVPIVLGNSLVVIGDIKTLAHVFSKDTYTYNVLQVVKHKRTTSFGPIMLSAEGEEHTRWRRDLLPSFSPRSIRGFTSIFYDSAYKLKTQWDAYCESGTEVTIDVQNWISRLTLDSVGIAAFGHDFKALEGCSSSIMEVLEEFNHHEDDLPSRLTIFMGSIFPIFLRFPANRAKLQAKFRKAVSGIAKEIISNELERRKLCSNGLDMNETSLLNMITKEVSAGNEIELGLEEMIAYASFAFYIFLLLVLTRSRSYNLFLVAGYDTTSVSITWALIDLARHPDIQQKLREELQKFSDCDPSWDQLKNKLSYLDAVVHESLRLHLPAEQLMRTAAEDDILPLSNPIQTASGEVVDSLSIQKGTMIMIPYVFLNTSEEFWGSDAKQFNPDRWFGELRGPAKDFRGYRHLYTFGDGPRICPGKDFALAELKATLAVLIKNYTFELPDGPSSEFAYHKGFKLQPKLIGQVGTCIPMRVRQVAKD